MLLGEPRRGDCRRAEIKVENLGTAPLEVQAPFFRAGSAPDFEFDGDPPGAFTLSPAGGGGSPTAKIIQLKYCQLLSDAPTATLVLRSNDPNEPEVLVGIVGPTILNLPPVCACDPASREVRPLDTITLSGAGCTDPEGEPLQYSWTIERRPPGSTSQLQNPASRDATFFVDLATPPQMPYVFRVTATDSGGASDSCEVKVFANPCCTGFHVQLVPDREGTDVDLLLASPLDKCSAANPDPDWGVLGDPTDNPRCSSENASYPNPAAGLYRLSVQYTCDHGLGATGATVRVYCSGQEAATFGPHSLAASGAFWEVATLEWPGCVLTRIDQTSTVPSGCGGP